MTNKTRLLGAAALGLILAACGTSPQERTTGGAAAGAATGAGVGALGGPVGALAGAAIGGGVGAVAGATTSPDTVNLGEPVWNDPEVRVPGTRSSASDQRMGSRTQRDAQRALRERGYEVGPIDGIWGPRSRRAAERFQRDQGMEASGRLNQSTMQALNMGNGSSQTGTSQTGSSQTGSGQTGSGQTGMGSGASGGGTPPSGTTGEVPETQSTPPMRPRTGAEGSGRN